MGAGEWRGAPTGARTSGLNTGGLNTGGLNTGGLNLVAGLALNGAADVVEILDP
jgi:hypothetical protein